MASSWDFFLGGYVPTVLPSEYQNINKAQTANVANWFKAMFGLGMPSGYMDSALGRMGQADSFWKAFLGSVPELQGLVTGASSPYAEALRQQYANLTRDLIGQTAQELSQAQAYHSSAFADILGRRLGEAGQQYATNAAQLQSQLMGSLYGTAMPLFQAAGAQSAENILRAAGILGEWGSPTWVAPTYTSKPGLLQALANIAAMVPVAGQMFPKSKDQSGG